MNSKKCYKAIMCFLYLYFLYLYIFDNVEHLQTQYVKCLKIQLYNIEINFYEFRFEFFQIKIYWYVFEF